MKFTFLVHPLSQESSALMDLDGYGSLRRSWGNDVFKFCNQLHLNLSKLDCRSSAVEEVRMLDEFSELVSDSGQSCEGRLYEIPMDATQILSDPNRALGFMEQAVDDAVAWGAEIIGLGSMTGIVGSHGQYLADRGTVSVTTGNSLTTYSAKQNLVRACDLAGIRLLSETVAVVGVPGSIGTALARMLAPISKKLICVSRSASNRAKAVADEVGGTLTTNIQEALNKARVVITATSSGDCIDQNWLLPGSLVVDVAVPTDVIGNELIRDDICVLTGGMVLTPDSMSRDSMLIGFNRGMVPSCFGETVVLALENRRENFSIGRELCIDGIMDIGGIAESHGFDFSKLTSFGVPLEDSHLARFQKAVYQSRKTAGLTRKPSDGAKLQIPPVSIEKLSQDAIDKYERCINPVLVALGRNNGFVKTFVKGQDCYVWDKDDRKYLDFVSGFGSLNVGHNHPVVKGAIQSALGHNAPGFAQSAVNPLTAELANRLVASSPNGLEMVSFCNSGTEAIEAAIKLVRASSDRDRILYCKNSYHGKTLGSLSLTGNQKFQKPFGPLVGNMDAVEFGNQEQLEKALESKQYAAFFVEPMQCEGGMNVPPLGYLTEVEACCRRTGTLLVLDEIQTGLGRTGTMFYADHESVTPHIMTLAKSLGGGLIPCGAMMCQKELWIKAYGSVENFMLHTSTFAGGSLAMAAGLATLDVLENTSLIENCEQRSQQLLEGLGEFAKTSDLIHEVRGKGLLIGIEFNPLPKNIVRHFAASDQSGLNQYLVPDSINVIRYLAPIYVMQTLLEEFGIYTQVARSRPSVLRVQPPLSVTADQIDEFLLAIEKSCQELSFSNRITDSMIAKSGTGELEKRASVS